MRLFKKLALVIQAIALVALVIPVASADGSSVWVLPDDHLAGTHGVVFSDQSIDERFSALINQSMLTDSTKPANCFTISDTNCVGQSNLTWKALLPVCQLTTDVNCIESMGVENKDGSETPGNFSRYFPAKGVSAYQGDSSHHLPTGAEGSFWEIPTAQHASGDLYYVTAFMHGGIDLSSGDQLARMDTFQVQISPVSLSPENYDSTQVAVDAGYQATPNPQTGGKSWGFSSFGTDGVHACIAMSDADKKCALLDMFPQNVRFFVKVRTNLNPSGWLHGRLANPAISSTTTAGVTTLDVAADPVQVPIVYFAAPWKSLPPDIQAQYSPAYSSSTGGFSRICCSMPADPNQQNYISQPSASGDNAMGELALWLPFLKNTATAYSTEWVYRTLNQNELSGANSCFTNSSDITGIVTTNSTEYSAGPPEFDKTSGSLNYKVESPHYLQDQSVFKGTYDLLMRSDVARCVYGFSKAPIKASISITGSDGSSEVATTVFGESNGWVHLAANNFEFSSPTVSVKLSQDSAASSTSASPSPSKSAQTASASPMPKTVSKSINCVKGKTMKKVTGINPVCPMSYKLHG